MALLDITPGRCAKRGGSMEQLKPCPFCGSDATIEVLQRAIEELTRYRIECKCCWCATGWDYLSEEMVIEAWNRRANDEHI